MSRHNYKKSRLKSVFLAFSLAAACAFTGVATACGNTEDGGDDNDKTTAKEDTQLLKNGNFEIFTIPEKKKDGREPEYLIKTPTNWTHGGTSSYTMSGIISTSKTSWDKLSADTLEGDLEYNNKLDSSSSNYLSEYVDYNGMKTTDILYKDQFEALKSEDDIKEGEENPNRKDRIENPQTHYRVHEKDGGLVYTADDGSEKPVYTDEKGEYYLEYNKDKDEYSNPISNVLMLHNYATSHNGIAQNYSSVEIDLPANTAAEVSVWVKTAHLKFSQGKAVSQDRGANISVTQKVGSSSLDKFTISCINTEKLISEGVVSGDYNGWVEYTVYINACDFASSTISLELGLGETGYTTEGYAFFDDVTVKKFASLDSEGCSYGENEDKLGDRNTCNLSSEGDEKVFKADSYVRNNKQPDKRNSEDFHYYIDLASEHLDYGDSESTYTPVSFSTVKNLSAGYTVDADNYVSSKEPITAVNKVGFKDSNLKAVEEKWRLPFTSSLKTDEDLIAYVKTKETPFTQAQTEYYQKLNTALSGAANLPKNSDWNNDNMLVLLSAYGAAYTASFDLTVPAEGYQIVAFWVKTTDLGGSTAATLAITQKDNDENTANFTLDTTDVVTNIGDKENEKDIFGGWVQCFFYVRNELDHETDYTVDFSFGNTSIKGSDVHAYKKGWAALANMQTLNVNEKVFSYTGSGDRVASLTITEEAKKKTHVFDEAYANQSHAIKNDMVVPSTYRGVNGESSAVIKNSHVSIPFDEFNNNRDGENAFTGLINKEHFQNGNYGGKEWYNTLLSNFNVSTTDAVIAWNEIFGTKSVQPLIINNRTRTSYVEERGATAETFKQYYIKDENGKFQKVADDATFDENETYYSVKLVRNYGYIGEDKSVNADSYSAISVRVKASQNAVAYVYLVDTSAGKNVLSFNAPSYSFYYDVDGNVLKAEPKQNATVTEQRENVAYKLRSDGLYEDKDGKLYANTWNYDKLYYIEDMTYYDADGKQYGLDDLKDGVTYFDENKKEANHYLVTGDGVKIYEFKDGAYHYIVEGKTQSETVTPFSKDYAIADYKNISEDYFVRIDGSEHPNEWVTVTFVIHAGSEAKSYRLELWSGERDKTGVSEGEEKDGTVIFDYSYTSVTDDTLKTEYEKEIIRKYQVALADKDGALDAVETAGKNITYYEKLAEKHGVSIDAEYKARYYTFSLYDSPNFKPFNKDVASDGATGYDYNVSDQTESLAFLSIREGNEYTIFTDYSALDKNVTLNNPSDDTDDDNTDEDNSSDGSVWLLASSIILVIALLFAMVAIFLKDFIKKARRNRVTSKNNYDHRKTARYKKKLHLKQEEIVEVDAPSADAADGENAEPTDEQ